MEDKIDEIITRWYKNPPYPLPEWMDKWFIKGLSAAQRSELLALFTQSVEEIKNAKCSKCGTAYHSCGNGKSNQLCPECRSKRTSTDAVRAYRKRMREKGLTPK